MVGDGLDQAYLLATGRQDGWNVGRSIFAGVQGAVASAASAAAAWRSRACFAAGTPLRTPDGSKPIEQFVGGDWVLSRDENDAAGPVLSQRVEEVFVRTGHVWLLSVGGKEIHTTGEHPFFAEGHGWKPLAELAVGDRLLGENGDWLTIEALEDTGRYETVYNLKVSDYSTYFVGCEEWGFSVWVHNTYSGPQMQAEVAAMLEKVGHSPKAAARIAKQYAKDGFLGDGLHATLKAYIDGGGGAYTYPGSYTRAAEKALTGAKPRLPKDGVWTGEPGHSRFIPDNPAALGLNPGEAVPFRNGRPLFTQWRKGERITSPERLTGDGPSDRDIFHRTLRDHFNGQQKLPHDEQWTLKKVDDWLGAK